ncbi:MAG: hypothetical protein VKK04_00560 [Synechococcales bacterium]|nr:hypothetical protein [Synechococcales bacterium]
MAAWFAKFLQTWKLHILVLGLAVLGVLSILKGFVPRARGLGLYIWLTTYQHGFIRRGLLGTLVSPWVQNSDPEAVRLGLVGIHVILLILIGGLAAILAWEFLRRHRQRVGYAFIFLACFFSSHFLGTIAYNAAEADAIMAVLLILIAIFAGSTAAGLGFILILVIGTLIHEMFLISAFPLILYSVLTPLLTTEKVGDRRRTVFSALVLLGSTLALVILILHTNQPSEEFRTTFLNFGMSERRASQVLERKLGQSLGGSLVMLAGIWRSHGLNASMGLAYSLLPSVGMLLIYWGWLKKPEFSNNALGGRALPLIRTAFFLLACYGPVLVLALAFDLSRLAQFANLTTFLTCVMDSRLAQGRDAQPQLIPEQEVADQPDQRISTPGWRRRFPPHFAAGLGGAIASIYLLSPVSYLYFSTGRIVEAPALRPAQLPLTPAAKRWMCFYNRKNLEAHQQASNPRPRQRRLRHLAYCQKR